jgi:hypothetical protein
VSKAVCFLLASMALFAKISWKVSRKRSRVLRSLLHAIPFQNTGETILAALLVYQFRGIERRMGSRKYGAFMIYASIIGYILQHGVLKYMQRESATGLYPFIFANIVGYYIDVPPQSSFSAMGISLSEKSFIYLLAVQLMFALSGRSFIAAMSGILAGTLYYLNFLYGQKWLVPHAVVSLL